MKLLRQLLLLLSICFAGEWLHRFFHIPVPGSVLGMVILFTGLCTGVIKLEMLSEISRFLIDHLAFFFVPAGVGLLACMDLLRANWAAILGISFITTVVVMAVTGHTVQILKRRSSR